MVSYGRNGDTVITYQKFHIGNCYFQMGREASRVKWDPKVSWETRASLHGTPARQELMESQGTKDSQGPPDHLGQMVSGGILGAHSGVQTKKPGQPNFCLGFLLKMS